MIWISIFYIPKPNVYYQEQTLKLELDLAKGWLQGKRGLTDTDHPKQFKK